ncbi:spore coat protein JB [Natronincola peptidivorans]|uniref:Spore coat protein JB n=1 Tax=Natronincola peptidivorans TaxID=426128 RepID=A0A1I0DL51_9FIRM|nr:spore coat protein CotJB [Natronincola peptidivorans]SET33213.1 spore coat protein JB [Natronincola peptidivorans]
MKERMVLMRQIQDVEFALTELQLYLDTHPFDQKALMDFNCYSQQLLMLKQSYEMAYGPLLSYGFSPSPYPWKWLDSPWPWEEQF